MGDSRPERGATAILSRSAAGNRVWGGLSADWWRYVPGGAGNRKGRDAPPHRLMLN